MNSTHPDDFNIRSRENISWYTKIPSLELIAMFEEKLIKVWSNGCYVNFFLAAVNLVKAFRFLGFYYYLYSGNGRFVLFIQLQKID